MSSAYVIDYEGVETALSGLERVELTWRDIIRDGRVQGHSRWGNAVAFLARRFGLFGWFRWEPTWRQFTQVFDRTSLGDVVEEEKAWCFAATRADTRGLRSLVRRLACEEDPEAARARAWKVLEAQSRRSVAWSEQIVALRMVQTLAVLDLEGYRRLVGVLGGYTPEEGFDLQESSEVEERCAAPVQASQ